MKGNRWGWRVIVSADKARLQGAILELLGLCIYLLKSTKHLQKMSHTSMGAG